MAIRPDEYQIFTQAPRSHLDSALITELPLHINDAAFADACVDAFAEIKGEDCLAKSDNFYSLAAIRCSHRPLLTLTFLIVAAVQQ